ncbi:hypothetical protein LCGC14_1631680, partial [marine sediment metagenome]
VEYSPIAGTPFVLLEIVDGESKQASLGSEITAIHRSIGAINIGIFVPIHQYGMPVLINQADQAMEGDDDSHKIELFEIIDESR